jgi:hypothetical protein
MDDLLVAAPLLVALGACVAGVIRTDARQPDWRAVLGGAVVSLIAAAIAYSWRDPDVDGSSVFFGVLTAALMLGALPVLIYFNLGRWLAGHRIVLGLIILATAVPLYLYYFLMLVLVFEVVGCPPDAYECPI